MYCDYCGKRGATYEVAISEDEAIHLCWFCEKRKDEIAEMFKGEKKIGCQNCKYFRQEDYHQTGYGTRHHYWCMKPSTYTYKVKGKEVTHPCWTGQLEKPKTECDEAVVGMGERWIQHL